MPTEKGKLSKKSLLIKQPLSGIFSRSETSEKGEAKPENVLREEKILAFWKEKKIFEKSLEAHKKGKTFVFYEGPPSANAAPGLHHVEARSFKDIIPRFKTMQGYFVPRRAGWDTHGLPVEVQVEKELGFKNKQDIEAFGIQAFNEKCREAVFRYVQDWQKLTERMAFWLDMEHAYITYAKSYMETLWWIIADWWKKKYLYQDFKVLPWCTRCGTGLSSHELALGYQSIVDTSVYIRFKITSQDPRWKNVSILSWTTTPWTLPGNVALAVSQNFQYVRVPDPEKKGNWLVVGKENFPVLVKRGVFPKDAKPSVPFPGTDLVGVTYQSLFDVPELASHESYKVYPADFVLAEEGTGIVHTAVMYGEDDYKLGKAIGLPLFHTVMETGKFIPSLKGLAGKYAKAKDTEMLILQHLQRNGALFHEEAYEHEYPFCWRCNSPIFYYARSSWWVRVNALRKELLKNNETIHWVPSHLKHGRFGEWLKEEKDWAFSRERFWGTTLPLWRCEACGDAIAISSVEELASRGIGSGNRYIVMRHGGAKSNANNFVSSWPEKQENSLTEKGKEEVKQAANALREEHIDYIYTSDLARTQETARIIKEASGVQELHNDIRLREIHTGEMNGAPVKQYVGQFSSLKDRFDKNFSGGESYNDIRRRMMEFFREVDKKHRGKTILIVTHSDVAWMLSAILRGASNEELMREAGGKDRDHFELAGWKVYEPKSIPRNVYGEVDLHRPYVDEIKIRCSCGGQKHRVHDVADVWFDSGAMPFAQLHYPFEAKEEIDGRKFFPADYISEAVDQTRGWFYTLLAVSTLLGKGAPYKHVISLGHLLDKNGQKMSKSKGNIVDPWEMFNQYGADTVRWFFYTVNGPGDPKKFDEKEILLKLRGFLSTFWNSFVLFDTYTEKRVIPRSDSSSLLDRWILSRLQSVSQEMTEHLEAYDVVSAARLLESFVIEDFSNWYLRRSRRKFQRPLTKKEKSEVGGITAEVLTRIAELSAPFIPFTAEAVYQGLRIKCPALKEESVHLRAWPELSRKLKDDRIESNMAEVRKVSQEALRLRGEAKIKVRQPLALLTVRVPELAKKAELLKILEDEVNVKKVEVLSKARKMPLVSLDTTITEALHEEGEVREIIRNIQEMRRDLGLTPRDAVTLQILRNGSEKKSPFEKWAPMIKKEVNAKAVRFGGKKKYRIEREIPSGKNPLWVGVS